jgi:three-Cys-motif partner protein
MPIIDLFDNPFDEGTLAKLEIFEKYVEAWLPVFAISHFKNPIQIFDFFSGSGSDKNGIAGSPLRTIEIINKHFKILKEHNKIVHLFFNDLDKKKITRLEKVVSDKIIEYDLDSYVKPNYKNLPFSECLNGYSTILQNGCNLIFIDQNGFKEVNESVFKQLISLERTDFIFFISSSYIRRFAEGPELHAHHPNFDVEKIKTTPHKKVHNVICEEFHKYVPAHIKNYSLIPFSLMKEDKNNIYGLIFVCRHPLAADKFLHIVWRHNAINGNANFDIDEESLNDQGHLFDAPKFSKIESFQSRLRDKVLKGDINNNIKAYLFSLNEGHISSHASAELVKMKKEKLITFNNRSPLVNYNHVIKFKNPLEYKVLQP